MTPLMVISSLLNCMTLVAGHEQLQLKLTTPCPFSRNPKRCGLPFSRLRLTSESSISRCHFCHTKFKLRKADDEGGEFETNNGMDPEGNCPWKSRTEKEKRQKFKRSVYERHNVNEREGKKRAILYIRGWWWMRGRHKLSNSLGWWVVQDIP